MLWRTGRMPLLATPSALAGSRRTGERRACRCPWQCTSATALDTAGFELDHYAPECCGELGQRTWE